jgi:hypothetical protein
MFSPAALAPGFVSLVKSFVHLDCGKLGERPQLGFEQALLPDSKFRLEESFERRRSP